MATTSRSWGNRILFGTAVALLLAWSLVPILWNILTSFKTRLDIFSLPPKLFFEPNLDAYVQALGPRGILPQLRNSATVAVLTTVATLVMAAMAAYALARYDFRGRRAAMGVLLASRLLPPVSAVVALHLLFSSWGLIDTHLALVLIYCGLNVPLATWLIKSFVEGVPRDLEEAARVDGCRPLGAFMRITVPLAAPGIAATAIFVSVLAWNEFMFAFMFTSVSARTLPVTIAEVRGMDQFLWQQMATQTTILMIPALILSIYLQKYLIKGLTSGAVK